MSDANWPGSADGGVSTSFTVQDLLDLPLIRGARPELVSGDRLHRRPVRWIHTSEIYDISPLLKGGEVLLTTGLGLVGAGPAAVEAYVASLARQGVAALLMELGRTFTQAPPPLVDAALTHDLPLVLLHGVVPFIEVTEKVHSMLVRREVEELRRMDKVSARLRDVLISGAGVPQLMPEITAVTGAAAGLYSANGDLVAGVDVRDRSTSATEVEVGAGPAAWLVLADYAGAGEVAEVCAASVAVCLAQSGRADGRHGAPGADLVRALAAGHYWSSDEIAIHAGAAGLVAHRGYRAIGIAVELNRPTSARTGLSATVDAAREVFGATLAAEVDGDVLLATSVHPGRLRDRIAALADAIDGELSVTVGGGVVRVVAGPLVDDVAGLARSVPAAHAALQLARRLALGSRTVLASDLGVYTLLSGLAADAELERFVQEQLGALLEQDARRGSDLVQTLDAFLEAALSKTAAAEALGIRRQTMYGRLERIAALLGGVDFQDRQARTALDLALVIWRLRASAATGRRVVDAAGAVGSPAGPPG